MAEEALSNAPFQKMPKDIHPMSATLVKDPFDNPEWIFEVKWDGYRTIAEVKGRDVEIYSRNQISFNNMFPKIVEGLEFLGVEAVLDGEIVVLDETGLPNFELIQSYKKTQEGQAVYYIFDILYLNGQDLTGLPLLERKKILQGILPPHSYYLRESDFVEHHGNEFFIQVKRFNLEGMVAKKKDSKYIQGKRSKDWLKIKTQQVQEAVIGGYTEPRGGRVGFGSLILGVYENGKLTHIGNAGGGFKDQELLELKKKLEELEIKSSPFVDYGENGEHHWVEPRLVGEVKFAEWTRDMHMRQPIFLGLRDDKSPQEVKREIPKDDLGN